MQQDSSTQEASLAHKAFSDHTELQQRCVGTLLGLTCGDVLGAAVEFRTLADIRKQYGEITDFLPDRFDDVGLYTDDTEMAFALTTSLIQQRKCSAEHISKQYAHYFAQEPHRGYGPGASRILWSLYGLGADYRNTGTSVFPEGSKANGAAMRVAPIGLAFRNASIDVLHRAVYASCLCTHVHPEAIDGAFIQALAVAQLCKIEDTRNFNAVEFVTQLKDQCKTPALKENIQTVLNFHAQRKSDEEMLDAVCEPSPFGRHFQIRAVEAVPCALWTFIKADHSQPMAAERVIIDSVSLGGDADTVAAIAGALVGALHGTRWIPDRWYSKIENESDYGRDAIASAAKQLADLDLTSLDDITV